MIHHVAFRNLKGHTSRSAGMAAVVTVLAFALLAGFILNESLSNGASAVESRLGADIMVVPDGYGDAEESILIGGEPYAFYMDRGVYDKVSTLDGISKLSYQIYMTSIPDADCCDFMVEIVGYDPATDFTITPWIAETYSSDGIIVGSNIYPSIYPDGQKVTFFGHQFDVAAKLSPSGTGTDNTVYMDLDTFREALAYSGSTDVDPDNQISSALIQLEDGYNENIILREIMMFDVDIVKSEDVLSDITGQMGSLIGFVGLFQVTIVFMAAVVLVALFSLYVFENRKEYAILRMIGATKASVSGLVVTEAAVVSVIGGVIGILLAISLVVPLGGMIGDAIGMPYVTPSFGDLMVPIVVSFLISAAIGTISALMSAIRIARGDAYSVFREGE